MFLAIPQFLIVTIVCAAVSVDDDLGLLEKFASRWKEVSDISVAGKAEGLLFRDASFSGALSELESIESECMVSVDELSFSRLKGILCPREAETTQQDPGISPFRLVWDGVRLRQELFGFTEAITENSAAAVVSDGKQILVSTPAAVAGKRYLSWRDFFLVPPYSKVEQLQRFRLRRDLGEGRVMLELPCDKEHGGVRIVVNMESGTVNSYQVLYMDSVVASSVVIGEIDFGSDAVNGPVYVRQSQLQDGRVKNLQCVLLNHAELGVSIAESEFTFPAIAGTQVFDSSLGAEVFRVPQVDEPDVVAFCLKSRVLDGPPIAVVGGGNQILVINLFAIMLLVLIVAWRRWGRSIKSQ